MPVLLANIEYFDLGPNEIRLVDIQPGQWHDPPNAVLRVVDLREQPLFEALSYCWKPTDGTVDTSHDDENRPLGSATFPRLYLHVGANLFSAIQHLRYNSSIRTMWIDAVSINQEDKQERSRQVALMKTIYSSSQRVVVWLGPAGKRSDLCMNAISTGILEEADAYDFCSGLGRILRRDWFYRLWVIQEYVVAVDEPLVCCGTYCVEWAQFAIAVMLTDSRDRQALRSLIFEWSKTLPHSFPRGLSDYRFGFKWPESATQMWQLMNMKKSQETSFAQRFSNRRSFKSTDPRDQVYGLLGICDFRGRPIVADYAKTVQQVYAEAAGVIMQEDFYLYVKMHLWGLDGASCHLGVGSPTWTSDLSRRLGTFSQRYRRPTTINVVPPNFDLRHALEVVYNACSKAPVVSFPDDYSVLHTVGRCLGKVEQSVPVVAGVIMTVQEMLFPSLKQALTTLNEDNTQDFTHSLVSALVHQTTYRFHRPIDGTPWIPSEDCDALHSAIVQHLSSLSPDGSAPDDPGLPEEDITMDEAQHDDDDSLFGDTSSQIKYQNPLSGELDDLLNFTPNDRFSVFTTSAGVLGITSYFDRSKLVAENIRVMGLFGVNMPFLLEHLGGDEYKIVAACYIPEHHWGHDFIEDADPGTGYETFLSDGRLIRINIH
jgi:hypothetical protein